MRTTIVNPISLPLCLVFVLWCLITTAGAEIYRYIDKNGTIHFTNIPAHPGYHLYRGEKVKTFRHTQEDYDSLIKEISFKYRVNPALVKAVIVTESGFNPYAVSKKGAQGLMQLMPTTAKDLQVYDPFHPRDNINGGVKYLRQLLERFNYNLSLTLAAYNAGPECVEYFEGIPPYKETQEYVRKVLTHFNRYQREL